MGSSTEWTTAGWFRTLGGAPQVDLDGDGLGDACDDDIDGDGMLNLEDPCPLSSSISVPSAADRNTCFPDFDGDGVSELDPVRPDLCPSVFDPDQLDADGDSIGDACDSDLDGDGLGNALDNCNGVVNADQLDADRDGRGDACDPTYCFVVLGDEANCLDPEGALRVYAPSLLADTGVPFRLPLFVNRETGTRIEYQWSVVNAPVGSSATVENARGIAVDAINYEFAYPGGSPVSFTADAPGTYEIRLSVVLPDGDPVTREANARAEYLMTVVANGEATDGAGGCATAPASTSQFAWFLLVLLALPLASIRRRR